MKQALVIIIGVVAILFSVSAFAMLLWNGVGHTILGLKHIGYWQMWGIILLANFIFDWHPIQTLSKLSDKDE
jgi:hypothetical protein